MNVGELRRALEDVADDMDVLLRVELSDGAIALGKAVSAEPQAGCGEDGEMFTIDATEGE